MSYSICISGGCSLKTEKFHDRLSSVRQVIDTSGNVKNRYTYRPFGRLFDSETEETITNPFRFAGQWFDSEIGEYYLRARMYDPYIGRFTSRDPVFGKFKEPMTLHAYLYCQNDPVNKTDPTGETSITELSVSMSIGAIIGAITSVPQYAHSGDWRDLAVGAAGGAATGFATPWFSGYGLLAKSFGSMMGAAASTITQENINRAWLGKESEHFMANLLTSSALGFGLGLGGGYIGESFVYRDALMKGLSGEALSKYTEMARAFYINMFGLDAVMLSESIWQGTTGEWEP